MNPLTVRLMYFASNIRIAAGIALLGVISYGIYILISDSIMTGALWIAPTIVLGWVANKIFTLVCMLICGMGTTNAARR